MVSDGTGWQSECVRTNDGLYSTPHSILTENAEASLTTTPEWDPIVFQGDEVLQSKDDQTVYVVLSLVNVSAHVHRHRLPEHLPLLLINRQAHRRITGHDTVESSTKSLCVHMSVNLPSA